MRSIDYDDLCKEKCSPGYTSGDAITACRENVCICDNGVPNTGEDCSDGDENARTACDSCNPGFHNEAGACVANVCTCTNGNGTTGEECSDHSIEFCDSCDNGFILENNKCIECTDFNSDGNCKTCSEIGLRDYDNSCKEQKHLYN